MSWLRASDKRDESSYGALVSDGPKRPSSSPAELPEEAGGAGSGPFAAGCSDGWAAYWLMNILTPASFFLETQITPGLALEYFNGWRGNPCGGGIGNASVECQAVTAQFLRVKSTFTLVGQVVAMVATPVVGMLSDSFGRWPFFVVYIGILLTGTLAVAAIYFMHASFYYWFVLNHVLANLMPHQVLFWGWIMDKTAPASRVPIFGLLLAVADAEGFLCPLISIFLGDSQLVVSAVGVGCGALFISLCFLPESLPLGHRRPLQSPLGMARDSLVNFWVVCRSPALRPVLVVTIIGLGAQTSLQRSFLVFMQERFGAERQEATPMLVCSSIVALFTQLFLLRPLNDIGGLRLVIAVGVFCVVVGHGTFPFFSFTLCWGSMVFCGLGTMAHTAYPTLAANLCPANERGSILGPYNALMNLGVSVFVFLFDRLHAFFATPNLFFDHPFPGAPLVLCVLVELASVLYLVSSWPCIEEAQREVEAAEKGLEGG